MARNTYFENPDSSSGFAQYRGSFIGAQVEHGRYKFSGTGTTVEVPTYFSKLLSFSFTPIVTTTQPEQLFCDMVIDTGTGITVSRVIPAINREFHFPLDEGQIDTFNYVNVPLLIAQGAMTLTQFEFYHGIAFGGGTTICNLGKSTDDGFYLEDISVTNAADTTAAGVSTTDFSSGDGGDGSAVADGDVLIFETEGGTGSGPGDGVVSIKATETLTYETDLTFTYFFIGLH